MYHNFGVLLFLHAATALAANVNGSTVCNDFFGLCAGSLCTYVPGNSGSSYCACEGPFQDLNLGKSTCLSRTQRLTSEYSIHGLSVTSVQPQVYALDCTGSNAGPWTNCLDAPCSTQSFSVNCTCPVVQASNFTTFVEKCPVTAAELKVECMKLRSSAPRAAVDLNTKILQSFYGVPPQLPDCPRLG